MQTCPCQQETHALHVVQSDNSEHNLQVTIRVSGECAAPLPEPPPVLLVPVPLDNSGPSIEDVGLEARGSSDSGCRAYAHARVSDSSGVSWVRLHYRPGGDDWNTIDMGNRGGASYESPIPGTSGGGGTIEFYLEASDGLGNTGQTGNTSRDLPFCGPG
jgi:hypothetical protein